jgi:hypothetical protein
MKKHKIGETLMLGSSTLTKVVKPTKLARKIKIASPSANRIKQKLFASRGELVHVQLKENKGSFLASPDDFNGMLAGFHTSNHLPVFGSATISDCTLYSSSNPLYRFATPDGYRDVNLKDILRIKTK